MSVDQIRAALDTIDATPRDGFLGELEDQLVAAWTERRRTDVSHVTDITAWLVGSRRAHAPHRGVRVHRRWMLVAAAIDRGACLGLLAGGSRSEIQIASKPTTVPPTPAPSTNPATTPSLPTVDSSPARLPATDDRPRGADECVLGQLDFDRHRRQRPDDGDRAAGDGSAQMTLHDDAATVACSGAAATVTGTGQLQNADDLVITISDLTCGDGSEPAVPGANLGAYTFAYDSESDTLTDNFGVVWWREGAEAPSLAPPASGAMWPQSSVDEVREAQERADAGDPAYTWQVDPQLGSAEWSEHLWQPGRGDRRAIPPRGAGLGPVPVQPVRGGQRAADGVIRTSCTSAARPARRTPCTPTHPPRMRLRCAEQCAPTIDDLHYETVSFNLSQPDRRGSRRDLGRERLGDWRAVRAGGPEPRRGAGDCTPRGLPPSPHRG